MKIILHAQQQSFGSWMRSLDRLMTLMKPTCEQFVTRSWLCSSPPPHRPLSVWTLFPLHKIFYDRLKSPLWPMGVPLCHCRASRCHCAWRSRLPRTFGWRRAAASSRWRRLRVWSTGARPARVLCWVASWHSQARRSRSQAPRCWAVLSPAGTTASCLPR